MCALVLLDTCVYVLKVLPRIRHRAMIDELLSLLSFMGGALVLLDTCVVVAEILLELNAMRSQPHCLYTVGHKKRAN